MLTATIDALRPVAAGHKLVMLDLEGRAEQAFVKDLQFDHLGQSLLHVDFMRVDAGELMRVRIPIHLKGTAPGAVAGGIVEQPTRELEIECQASDLPEFIEVKISHLELGGFIHVSDLVELPAGVTVLNSPDTVLVHIVTSSAVEEPMEAEAAPAEPELIRKREAEEEV